MKNIFELFILETFNPKSPFFDEDFEYCNKNDSFEERKIVILNFISKKRIPFLNKQLDNFNEIPKKKFIEILDGGEEGRDHLIATHAEVTEELIFLKRMNYLGRVGLETTNHFLFQDAFGRALHKSASRPRKGWEIEDIPSLSLLFPKNGDTDNLLFCYQISVKSHEWQYLVETNILHMEDIKKIKEEVKNQQNNNEGTLAQRESAAPVGKDVYESVQKIYEGYAEDNEAGYIIELAITRFKSEYDGRWSLGDFNETITLAIKDGDTIADSYRRERGLRNKPIKETFEDWDLNFIFYCIMYVNSGDPDIRHMKGSSSKGIDFSGKKRTQKLRKYKDTNFISYTSVGWDFKKGWYVSGYWRNQPYGVGRSLRRPQYIPGFPKGDLRNKKEKK